MGRPRPWTHLKEEKKPAKQRHSPSPQKLARDVSRPPLPFLPFGQKIGTRFLHTKPSWILYRLCVNGGSGYHDSRAKQTRHMQKSQVARAKAFCRETGCKYRDTVPGTQRVQAAEEPKSYSPETLVLIWETGPRHAQSGRNTSRGLGGMYIPGGGRRLGQVVMSIHHRRGGGAVNIVYWCWVRHTTCRRAGLGRGQGRSCSGLQITCMHDVLVHAPL